MKKTVSIVIAVGLLAAGCGTLIPKRVEFFQDKVAKFPERTPYEEELRRKVADLAKRKAQETLAAAQVTGASPHVLLPAEDTAILAESVSLSLGPPVAPAPIDTEARRIAAELATSVAKLNLRLDEFKKDNNENAGKKIEGTGLFSVPYFVWIGIVLVLVFIGFIILSVLWTFLKMAAVANPPVALGVGAAQVGANLLKRGLNEVAEGGERFKNSLTKVVQDPALAEQIKELFRSSQERAQSRDVQELVRAMTMKA